MYSSSVHMIGFCGRGRSSGLKMWFVILVCSPLYRGAVNARFIFRRRCCCMSISRVALHCAMPRRAAAAFCLTMSIHLSMVGASSVRVRRFGSVKVML